MRIISSNQIVKIFKYGLVGVLGTTIHFLSLIFFVEVFQLGPILSSSLGFIIVVILSYYLNKKWTFQTDNKIFTEFTKYLITSCVGLLLNMVIMRYAIDILEWDYLTSQLLVTIAIPISNFILNSLWTFKK
ncbi:hypothetical protein AV654_06245 [Paenibacillus elgii]|uniref:GtrA/DPMS transmembrane domain-containing protein n=1 Tax=Paenibacillus elgii TaxID=189691 RepID=A0A163SZC3_9BACL|nr:hypothetical protein AV654_06245 [Paenibacillus elgii]